MKWHLILRVWTVPWGSKWGHRQFLFKIIVTQIFYDKIWTNFFLPQNCNTKKIIASLKLPINQKVFLEKYHKTKFHLDHAFSTILSNLCLHQISKFNRILRYRFIDYFFDIINLSNCEIYSTFFFFIVADPNRDWTQLTLSYLCEKKVMKMQRRSKNYLKIHQNRQKQFKIPKTRQFARSKENVKSLLTTLHNKFITSKRK